MAPRATQIPTDAHDREIFLAPYLPKDIANANISSSRLSRAPQSVALAYPTPLSHRLIHRLLHPAETLAYLFHLLLFTLIQFAFTILISVRRASQLLFSRTLSVAYHHHRTPELIRRDVATLSRLPKHLSVILEQDASLRASADGSSESLTKLIADAAEVAAWTAAAGIPMLSIYERTGALKAALPDLHEQLFQTFGAYYRAGSEPDVRLRAPHLSAFEPAKNGHGSGVKPAKQSLDVLLLSEADGRGTLVDLTKTLTEMAQGGRLRPQDVTQELIDAEMTAASCGEPDLLILMTGTDSSGGSSTELKLRGYPCWQVRLTEIFHAQDNPGVDYQVFLRALYRYAKAQMRFGR